MRNYDVDFFSIFNELDTPFKTFPQFFDFKESVDKKTWSPRYQSKELESSCQLYLEVPGVKEEDLEIKVDENLLYITGFKNKPFSDEEPEQLHLKRVFTLPEEVSVEDISVNLDLGILAINLPKVIVEKKERVIPINKVSVS